jgi:hypothetical protein
MMYGIEKSDYESEFHDEWVTEINLQVRLDMR